MKKQLPTGIQTFADIHNGTYYYVDKTPYFIELVKERAVFLSRPRHFGKSLTIDTLDELFSGNRELFEGLYAETHWNWDKKYPVIRIGFTEGEIDSSDYLRKKIRSQIDKNAKKFGVIITDTDFISDSFQELIENIATKYNSKVVILIDEYDKPLLDNIKKEPLLAIRSVLRDLYSVIKGQDANLRFTMLTGVSKFSRVNIFSGLNSLTDITLMSQYSAICGYTQEELETIFATELTDVTLEEIKKWYNGYNWRGESVYNPFDILLFLKEKVFEPYWFTTGGSAWLVDNLAIKELDMHRIESNTYSSADLARFDIDDMYPIAVLFQTGYLTIKESIPHRGIRYRLKYPNIEVQQSLNELILKRSLHPRFSVDNAQDSLYDYLLNAEYDKLQQLFHSFFAGIPHQWYVNDNIIAGYEGHWASVFYGFLTGLGVRVYTEDSTNHGRMDVWFDFNDVIYIIEFKLADNEKEIIEKRIKAIEQIKERGYADKFKSLQRERNKPIVLMGIVLVAVNVIL